jgi:hypothetical protein
VGSTSSTAERDVNPDELAHRIAVLLVRRRFEREVVQRTTIEDARREARAIDFELEQLALQYLDVFLERARANIQYHKEVMEKGTNAQPHTPSADNERPDRGSVCPTQR